MLDFVREVKAKAGDRPLLFCKTANRELAVQAFLGVNQRGQYPHEAPESGAWVIAEGPGDQPDALIESEPDPAHRRPEVLCRHGRRRQPHLQRRTRPR